MDEGDWAFRYGPSTGKRPVFGTPSCSSNGKFWIESSRTGSARRSGIAPLGRVAGLTPVGLPVSHLASGRRLSQCHQFVIIIFPDTRGLRLLLPALHHELRVVVWLAHKTDIHRDRLL